MVMTNIEQAVSFKSTGSQKPLAYIHLTFSCIVLSSVAEEMLNESRFTIHDL